VLMVRFERRTEEGKETGCGVVGWCPFSNGTVGSRGRGDGGSVARHNTWKEGDRSPSPNRRARPRRCSNRGAPGASDVWASANSGRERERRGAGQVGRPGEKGKWAEPEEI
jgi:hypothetical protein